MIGYKLLNKDMKAMLGNSMQYELGKKYIMYEKDVILYKSGYHFYKELEDCINSDVYYNELIQSRFFKVETGEYIKKDMYNNSSKNLVTNEIILLEEIFIKDIIEYCKENRNKINKMTLVKLGLFLDELIYDEDSNIRVTIAGQGKFLDKLYKDEDWLVRKTVAEQNAYIDILINDPIPQVRQAAIDRKFYKQHTVWSY